MTTQHTPGPWHYQPTAGDHDYMIYAQATGRDVALVRDFNEPNARLITLAPDLLDRAEKLQEAIQAYVRSGFHQAFFRHITDARSELQAVITEARATT